MSYGIEIPSRAMETNEIIELEINTNTRKGCTLFPPRYFLMKQYRVNEDKVDEFVFYAAKYESLPKSLVESSDPNNFPTQGDDRIGRAICTHGMIDHVHVADKFRGCGLATVFSVLCMLDIQINSNTRKYFSRVFTTENKVLRHLKRYRKNEQADFLRRCHHLVGLLNIAENPKDPKNRYAGAFAYISAAHRTGYQYLVVHRFNTVKYKCKGEFLHYEIDRIRDEHLYDGKTGKIDQIDGTGYQAYWYFCKR